MAFTLSTGHPISAWASASRSDGNTSSTITVTASAYCTWDDFWLYSTGVVAVITINGSTSYKTLFGNGNYYQSGDGTKSVSYSVSVDRDTYNKPVSWSVQFRQYTDGTDQGTKQTDSGSTTVPALASYSVSYNANGGTGAPGSQTKYYGRTLTLSSTKPTRTGYTFKGWATSSDGSVAYAAGASYTSNSSVTLYAIWEEHCLTVNYYSNYADYCTLKGDAVSVSSNSNTKVLTGYYYYDTQYSDGLADAQNENYLYLSRTGYTQTGKWGTSTSGGTLIDHKTSFSKGQALAEAFGKTLKTGNASVNVYAQWRENKLTVTYYSNYADYIDSDETLLNTVSADKNVAIFKYEFKYATSYNTYGLANYSNPSGSLYMTRTRYDATGYWCTTNAEDVKLEGNKNDVLTYDGGIAIGENKGFDSGQALAQALGLSLEDGDRSINLYANWVLLCSKITIYQADGTPIRGLVRIYDDDGNVRYGIVTVYDSDGNACVVV